MLKDQWKETPQYLMGIMALKDGTHHCTLWVCNVSNASWFMLMVIIYWVEDTYYKVRQVDASKRMGREVNSKETKYVVMSWGYNIGRIAT